MQFGTWQTCSLEVDFREMTGKRASFEKYHFLTARQEECPVNSLTDGLIRLFQVDYSNVTLYRNDRIVEQNPCDPAKRLRKIVK